jgi:hypothetical protein
MEPIGIFLEIVVGLAFGVTGFYQMRMFKKNMPFFYTKTKIALFVTNLGLSLPLILLGIQDGISTYEENYILGFEEWKEEHLYELYILNFVLGDVLCVFT